MVPLQTAETMYVLQEPALMHFDYRFHFLVLSSFWEMSGKEEQEAVEYLVKNQQEYFKRSNSFLEHIYRDLSKGLSLNVNIMKTSYQTMDACTGKSIHRG